MRIRWDKIHKDYKYVAIHSDGRLVAYQKKPELSIKEGSWEIEDDNLSMVITYLDYPNWRCSLRERPKGDELNLKKPVQFKENKEIKVGPVYQNVHNPKSVAVVIELPDQRFDMKIVNIDELENF